MRSYVKPALSICHLLFVFVNTDKLILDVIVCKELCLSDIAQFGLFSSQLVRSKLWLVSLLVS